MFKPFSHRSTRNRRSIGISRVGRARLCSLEKLEDRRLLAAGPMGALPSDTGEFLLGTIAVTPVLFESNGQVDTETQNWTAEEIDEVLAKVSEGVGWWSDLLDTLGTVHSLDFVIDDTFAETPFSTPYEPIDRPSTDFTKYVGGFLISQGQGGASNLEEAVYGFNQSQREKLGTDWSFTIFIVDSSDDADGLFLAGNSFSAAFAYAGGLFIVTPSTRPASTIAHEMGHIFWARDEYPGVSSWTDVRGYYDTQNLNAADNPTAGFQQEISIMRGGVPLTQAYESYVSPDSTLAMVGWQDSDGDGIFDVADVPLDIEGVGLLDSTNSEYRFMGRASAVPLINRNSSGNQSDITLNRVSEIQYRIDEGSWTTALTPSQQEVSFDITIPINTGFNAIEWRAIDTTTGITSPVFLGSGIDPAVLKTGLVGLSYYDINQNGVREEGEPVLPKTKVQLTNSDGSPLYSGSVQANDLQSGTIAPSDFNATFSTVSEVFGGQVAVESSSQVSDVKTFQYYDSLRSKWVERWNQLATLEIGFQTDVGSATATVYGFQGSSYARVEALNASGDIVKRVTSAEIAGGDSLDLTIERSAGDIRSVRIYGYAGTSIAVGGIEYGFNQDIETDENGIWQIPSIPEGEYRAIFQAAQVIYKFPAESQIFQLNHATYQVQDSGLLRVDSPQHNSELAGDVNQSGDVSASDALAVINDLNRYSPRILTWSDPTGFKVDVNNDGAVSALDALVVINSLAALTSPSGEWVIPDWETQVFSSSTLLTTQQEGFQTIIDSGIPPLGVTAVRSWDESEDSEFGSESGDSPNADRDEEKTYGPNAQSPSNWWLRQSLWLFSTF